jgi:hypothetical protein
MRHSKGISRRKQLLIAGVACIAGGIQAFRVVRGEGGFLAVVSVFSFLVVLLLTGWQLYTGSDNSHPNRL